MAATAMLDEPDGAVTAYFLVLRIRHAELESTFDIMLRVEADVYENMLERMQEYLRPTE